MSSPVLSGPDGLAPSRRAVGLRPARPEDMALAYGWLAHSDLTREMMGAPLFADRPVLDAGRFAVVNPPSMFDPASPFDPRGWIIQAGDEEVGFLRQGRIDLLRDVVELDVWLAARRYCGHGFGSAAIDLACHGLQRECGVNRFVLRPSLRNVHALRAMRRAGFRDLGLDPRQVAAKLALRAPDYADEVLLFRALPLPPARLERQPRCRYVFIDSEFTSLERPELISFGAIDDQGQAFYREVDGWRKEACSPFVVGTVLPLLDGEATPRAIAAAGFVAWLSSPTTAGVADDGVPVATMLVSDSGYDRWAVSQLLAAVAMPPGVSWLRVPIAFDELDRRAADLGLRRHHALDDARALRGAILEPEQ